MGAPSRKYQCKLEFPFLLLIGILSQYFGKFLPINKNKTIESVLAGSKLH